MERGKLRLMLALRIAGLQRLTREQSAQLHDVLARADGREALLAAVCQDVDGRGLTADWGEDGLVLAVKGPIVDSLRELFRFILENWDSIAKVILFIIGLFAAAPKETAGAGEPLVRYPDSVGTAVGELVRIVRAGSYVEEKELLALAAWNVQGFLQSTVLGPPKVKLSSELSELRSELIALECRMDADTVQGKAVPPWIFTMLRYLLDLLEQIFGKA